MKKQINRNDILRDVRYILSSHAVDLQKCQFSCSTDIVTVFGYLKKSPRGEFTMQGVVGLCRQLKALPYLRDVMFRFDNWAIDSNLSSILHLEKKERDDSGEPAETAEEIEKETEESPEDGTFRINKKEITDGINLPDDDMFL